MQVFIQSVPILLVTLFLEVHIKDSLLLLFKELFTQDGLMTLFDYIHVVRVRGKRTVIVKTDLLAALARFALALLSCRTVLVLG